MSPLALLCYQPPPLVVMFQTKGVERAPPLRTLSKMNMCNKSHICPKNNIWCIRLSKISTFLFHLFSFCGRQTHGTKAPARRLVHKSKESDWNIKRSCVIRGRLSVKKKKEILLTALVWNDAKIWSKRRELDESPSESSRVWRQQGYAGGSPPPKPPSDGVKVRAPSWILFPLGGQWRGGPNQ